MRRVACAREIAEALHRVKVEPSEYVTNLYATPAILASWIEAGELDSHEAAGCLLLFRRDLGFRRLYFAARSRQDLAGYLRDPDMDWRAETVTSDLVGRPLDVAPSVGAFAGAGFARYTTLIRMARVGLAPAPNEPTDPNVSFARPDEERIVHGFFENLLDRYSEQTPSLREIREAIADEKVLIVRREGHLAGALCYATTGVTTTLRYWFVAIAHQNRGVGAALMRRLLWLSRESRRIVLWVMADNHDAITKYEHYGFRRDGLVDEVMLRKGDAS